MDSFKQYIEQLIRAAGAANQRAAICLDGHAEWLTQSLEVICSFYPAENRVQLGGAANKGTALIPYNQGRLFLGNEYKLILVDLADEFDANSFAALTGTLTGGGLLCLFNRSRMSQSYAGKWLARALDRLVCLKQGDDFSLLSVAGIYPAAPECADFSQQQSAIEAIHKVLSGHRKRPLILTADRGRGKTSALGLAAGQIMQARSGVKILLCAPNVNSVSSAFYHAKQILGDVAYGDKYHLYYLESKFSFVAPDVLVGERPECDLLLIDEAAAIPLPTLKAIVANYHRVVFSSTLHGYEGCGLGFTHKFIKWLTQERPGFAQFHLSKPIRWAESDYLESWLNDAFFINVSAETVTSPVAAHHISQLSYRVIDKKTLFNSPQIFGQIFSILVNAHYQTTPNDLMLILDESAISVFVAELSGQIVACLLIAREGNLSAEMIDAVKFGRRRPKGQLVPVTLVNQLGCYAPAQSSCDRIMRIATHPEIQQVGIGSALLCAFIRQSGADCIATSFGMTPELLKFWQKNSFVPIKLGSQRDHVSGTHSLLMVHRNESCWVRELQLRFGFVLVESLATIHQTLSASLVSQLLHDCPARSEPPIPCHLIDCYALGGADYESVEVWIRQLVKRHIVDEAISQLMLAKILQYQNWNDCVARFNFAGKKQAEAQFRSDLYEWLARLNSHNLQCKN